MVADPGQESHPRSLQTVVVWPYLGDDRLLTATWGCDGAGAVRITAVAPARVCDLGAALQPIGVSLCCIAVDVGLAAGLSLTDIADAAVAVDASGQSLGAITARESVGALAQALAAAEAGGASAAAYALECRPAPEGAA